VRPVWLLAAALAAAGCDDDEAPAHRAARHAPARADHARFEVDFTADDRAVLFIEGRRDGEYDDGPALHDALARVRRDRPELAEQLSIRLPMVFGKDLRGDFVRALDDAGYTGLFGNPIR